MCFATKLIDMAVKLSTDDYDVLLRKVTLDKNVSSVNIADDFYEIDRCVQWITSNNFTCVALQFPDELLKDAADVSLEIEKETKSDVYVLGDTSYSSCCVDEIAAEHVSANAIIHFGHACFSPTNRLPVLYIVGKLSIDVESVAAEFRSYFPDPLDKAIVFHDPYYTHCIDPLKKDLVDYKNIIFAENDIPSKTIDDYNKDQLVTGFWYRQCGQIFLIPEGEKIASYNMFYIGLHQPKLVNLMLIFEDCNFYSYDPIHKVGRRETVDINRFLRQRRYCIEKVKDAKIIGILVGTLGVSNYLQAIEHLKLLCANANKKCYVIVVGKLNSAKLANFPEIDVFVYVSCSESSIVDSRDFYQTIVTPFEMELACNQARENWTGLYVTDFSKLLPGAFYHVPLVPLDDTAGDVSLITGKCRTMNIGKKVEEDMESDVVAMRDEMAVAKMHLGAAGERLANLNWRGLECRLGQTGVAAAIEGRRGIASAYDDER